MDEITLRDAMEKAEAAFAQVALQALKSRVRDEIGDYRKNLSLLERHATSTR